MEIYTVEQAAELILQAFNRIEALEKRLDALTAPEENMRASLAQTLRDIADDIDDELKVAPRTDPNEEDND